MEERIVAADPVADPQGYQRELLAHLWDGELAYAFRARLILAQDRPPLIGYDQEAWAIVPPLPSTELLDNLPPFVPPTWPWSRAPPNPSGIAKASRRARPTSFRLLTQTIAGRDRAHLRQLEQTIAAIGRSAIGQHRTVSTQSPVGQRIGSRRMRITSSVNTMM